MCRIPRSTATRSSSLISPPRALPRVFGIALLIGTLLAATEAQPQNAFEQSTESYRAYLGVTPASRLREAPELIDMDKRLHADLLRQRNMQHITIAVFDKRTNERVTDVTLIGRVRHARWRHPHWIERPLERMRVGGVTTFGNFFRMAEPGEYRIVARIYRTEADAPEIAEFTYELPEP